MRKKILIGIVGIFVIVSADAQVGINTNVPQGIFHIDPLGDTVGANNGSDDVVVLNNGNVGIGGLSPSTKLHIISPTAGAIRIEDGTQGAGRVLTSDDHGVGSWALAKGSLVNGVVFIDDIPLMNDNWVLTQSYIVIPPKVSCVVACMAQFRISVNIQPGLFMAFSTSNTSFVNASPSAQVIFNRQYSEANSYLICNGFVTDIENTTNTPMTLFLWARTDIFLPTSVIRFNPRNTVNDIKLYAIVN